jgi:hypothetical protein
MGLFHDTCDALVDLKTGRALSGEALQAAKAALFPAGAAEPLSGKAKVEALAARGWGVCGHNVSKKARVCSKCGSLAPNGYVKCPSCREWVGNESAYCPHCNHPLHPEERIDFAGGVWGRQIDVFAQRFDLDDVSQIVKGGLKIQEGTLAVLLDAGKKTAILGPGRHYPEGTLRNINWFGNPPPRSVVMVFAGDCLVKIVFPNLRTAEELPLSVVAELTMRFDADRADSFLSNLLVDLRALPMKTLSDVISNEATAAVKDLCAQSTVEDLVTDPDRRTRFQDAIGRALKDLCRRIGIELVRVGYVDFISPAYEKIRQANAELEDRRREVEFERKVRAFDLGKLKDDWSDEKARRAAGDARERDSAEENLTMQEFRLGVRRRANVIRSDSEREEAEAEKAHLDLEAQRMREKELRKRELADYLVQLAQEKELSDITRRAELAVASLAGDDEVERKKAEIERLRLSRTFEVEYDTLRHELKKVDLTQDIQRAKLQFARETEIAQAEHRNALSGIRDEGDLAATVAASRRQQVVNTQEIDRATAESTIGGIRRTDRVEDARADSTVSRLATDDRVYATDKGLDLRAKELAISVEQLKALQELESKERRERAAAMKGMSYAEMAAMADDPAERAQYLEMARLEKENDLKRHTLAAEIEKGKIQASVQVAQVQGQTEAAKAQAQAQAAEAAAKAQLAANDKTLEEVKSVLKDRAEHDERAMKMMQELAAKAIEKPETIINQSAPAQVIVPNAAPQPINIVK